MTCPCHNCLVYVRCKQRVERQKFTQDVYYTFEGLIQECDLLREFFELNTALHRIKVRKDKKYSYDYERRLVRYIEEQPRGKQLVEEFLKVMGITNDEMPNSINPRVRLKPGMVR